MPEIEFLSENVKMPKNIGECVLYIRVVTQSILKIYFAHLKYDVNLKLFFDSFILESVEFW